MNVLALFDRKLVDLYIDPTNEVLQLPQRCRSAYYLMSSNTLLAGKKRRDARQTWMINAFNYIFRNDIQKVTRNANPAIDFVQALVPGFDFDELTLDLLIRDELIDKELKQKIELFTLTMILLDDFDATLYYWKAVLNNISKLIRDPIAFNKVDIGEMAVYTLDRIELGLSFLSLGYPFYNGVIDKRFFPNDIVELIPGKGAVLYEGHVQEKQTIYSIISKFKRGTTEIQSSVVRLSQERYKENPGITITKPTLSFAKIDEESRNPSRPLRGEGIPSTKPFVISFEWLFLLNQDISRLYSDLSLVRIKLSDLQKRQSALTSSVRHAQQISDTYNAIKEMGVLDCLDENGTVIQGFERVVLANGMETTSILQTDVESKGLIVNPFATTFYNVNDFDTKPGESIMPPTPREGGPEFVKTGSATTLANHVIALQKQDTKKTFDPSNMEFIRHALKYFSHCRPANNSENNHRVPASRDSISSFPRS